MVDEASTTIAGEVEEQTTLVNIVSERVFGVKEKVMLNEEQANVMKNTVETLINLSRRLTEVCIRVKGVAEEINHVIFQFKIKEIFQIHKMNSLFSEVFLNKNCQVKIKNLYLTRDKLYLKLREYLS